MTTFRFRVFYRHDGPSYSDPFDTTPKSLDEIRLAFEHFLSDLFRSLGDSSATVDGVVPPIGESEMIVSISTEVPGQVVSAALAATLRNHRLYADDLSK